MSVSVPDAALTLTLLIGTIWVGGALLIKLADGADERRAALLARRRALLTRHGHRQARTNALGDLGAAFTEPLCGGPTPPIEP